MHTNHDRSAHALPQPAAGTTVNHAMFAGVAASAAGSDPSMERRIDALRASYSTVARLAGDPRFPALASAYACANPSATPARLVGGDGFERFLAGFAAASEMPCLPGVARLDRFWTEARAAGDDAAVDPRTLALLATEQLMRVVLRPQGSARWCWFDAQPIPTIWSRARLSGCADATGVDAQGEGALVLCTQGEVRWLPLDAAGHAAMVACANGGTLADAASAALAADPDADGAAVLGPLLDAGAFVVAPTLYATSAP